MRKLVLLDKLRRSAVIGAPMLWLFVFLFLPLLFVLKISLSQSIFANPPFTSMLLYKDGIIHILISLKSYWDLITHSVFLWSFISSLRFAFLTTLLCILIGYPIAYALSRCSARWRSLLFMLVILPYWTSFLLRAYAWTILLQNHGLVNNLLMDLGITHTPIRMIYTNFSVTIGLVYGYLPYFILPLYASLEKMDLSLIEAAQDLGAKPLSVFFRITVPLSLPGILAGSLLVFIPATGEVVIPQVLGGLNTLMIGNLVWQEFFIADNWPLAAALSIAMLLILMLPIILFERIQLKQSKGAKK